MVPFYNGRKKNYVRPLNIKAISVLNKPYVKSKTKDRSICTLGVLFFVITGGFISFTRVTGEKLITPSSL